MQTHSFLLISLLCLCAVRPKLHPVQRYRPEGAANAKTVLLEYTGHVSSPYASYAVGAQLTMDSSIGFRYDVTFQNGSTVLSHVALFYKFSAPHQTIFYNYRTQKSEVIKEKPSNGSTDIDVMGNTHVDSFSCTHLQHKWDHGSDDYWMSTAVPGFSQLCQILQHIDAGLLGSINETIFRWGGLVKLQVISTTSDGQTTFTLNLIEAQTGLIFQPSTFEVPKK